MNEHNELPEDVLDLLAQKKYHQLNDDEKDLVSNWLSEEGYNEYALILLDFKQMENSMEAPIPTQSIPEQRTPLLRKLMSYSIPAYQAVAAVLVTFFLVNLAQTNTQIEGSGQNKFTSANDSSAIHANPHQAIDMGTKSIGTPLSEDDYPEELVFNL